MPPHHSHQPISCYLPAQKQNVATHELRFVLEFWRSAEDWLYMPILLHVKNPRSTTRSAMPCTTNLYEINSSRFDILLRSPTHTLDPLLTGQSCPRVTFLGPDSTRPAETLTRPTFSTITTPRSY